MFDELFIYSARSSSLRAATRSQRTRCSCTTPRPATSFTRSCSSIPTSKRSPWWWRCRTNRGRSRSSTWDGESYLASTDNQNFSGHTKIPGSYHLVKEWLRAKFKGWTVARSKHHSQDKGNVMDVKNKKFVRSIPQWGGRTSKDGR